MLTYWFNVNDMPSSTAWPVPRSETYFHHRIQPGWNHYVVSYDTATEEIGLYVNGLPFDSGHVPGGIRDFGIDSRLWIGKPPRAVTQDWQGGIDEVSIFRQVLTPEQVHALYCRGQSTYNPAGCFCDNPTTHTPEQCTGGHDEDCDGQVDCNDRDCANLLSCSRPIECQVPADCAHLEPRTCPGAQDCYNGRCVWTCELSEDCELGVDCEPPPDPIAYFPLDGCNTEVAEDVIGSYDGEIEGANSCEGHMGHALCFDGDDWVRTGYRPDLDQDDHSFSLWLRNTPGSQGTRVALSHATGTDFHYQLEINNGSVYAIDNTNVNHIRYYHYLLEPEWNHVVVVYHRDHREIRTYINGEPHPEPPIKLRAGFRNVAITAPIWFSRPHHPSLLPWDGAIDDVMIFTDPLTPEMTRFLYHDGLARHRPMVCE